MFKCAVLTISDRCSRNEYTDKSGIVAIELINSIGGEIIEYEIVPDEIDIIKEKLVKFCDVSKVNVVITTGGTGLGPRDVTPEATKEVSDKLIPGISELMRMEGIKINKNAALSRGVSAIRDNTLIINLPGSPVGAEESLTSILDIVSHSLEMIEGKIHEEDV